MQHIRRKTNGVSSNCRRASMSEKGRKLTSWGVALAIIAALAGAIAIWISSKGPEVEAPLHRQVLNDGSIPILRRIAERAIAEKHDEVEHDAEYRDIRAKGVEAVITMHGVDGIDGVFFSYGGGADSHYGILVMRH